jgi:hypothetical protein
MANELDQFNLAQTGTLPPELYQQQQALNRQQQMAAMLMQQNQQPQGQMISGRYVPTSFFQNLQPVANMLTGAYLAKQGDTKAAALAEQLRTGKQAEQTAIMEKLNAGDTKGALALASSSQYGAGKEFVPALIGSVIPKTPEKVAEYNFAVQSGFKGSFNDFANQMTPYQQAQLGIEKQKLGMEQQKLANELNGGKLTESQGNATGFGVRAKEANSLLNQLEKSGTKDTGVTRATIAGIAGSTPFIGEKLQQGVHAAMNVLPSELGGPNEAQQATDQARRNFVTAVLRKESGAAISQSEFYNEAQKYFPQPGDSADVIRQKQHARNTAIRSLEIQAGPGGKIIQQFQEPKLDIGSVKNSPTTPIYATNGTQRIVSNDGGQTWQPVGGK